MLGINEMKVLRKIVVRTKIGKITSQQIRNSCGIKPINQWVEKRGREWDENITRMDAAELKSPGEIHPREEDLQDKWNRL